MGLAFEPPTPSSGPRGEGRPPGPRAPSVRPFRGTKTLALALALALAPGAARAEPARPRVLVVVVPEDGRTGGFAARVGDLAAARVAATLGLEAVTLEAALHPALRAEQTSAIEAAVHAVERGVAAFVELDLEVAAGELDAAIGALLAHADVLERPARRALEDAIYTSGATALFDGQKELAEATFVGLLLVAPDYRPSPALFPSKVIARFEALRAALEARPTGALTVATSPRGAEVWVDGRYRGTAPVEVTDLADGQHTVTVKRLGCRPYGTLAPVSAGRSASVDVDLEPLPGPDPGALLPPALVADVAALWALGRRLAVERLAFLRADSTPSGVEVRGAWLDVVAGRALGGVPATALPEDEAVAAGRLAELLLSVDGKARAPEPAPPLPPTALTERWWFWALAGAALVGGAAALAGVAGGADAPRRPRDTAVLGF